MDEQNVQPQPEETEELQRPAWQVWGARIGLVFFIGFVIVQLVSIARGGL